MSHAAGGYLFDSDFNFFEDLERLLASGIVGGRDHSIREPRRRLAHQRPLAPIPVPAAPEDDQDAAPGEFPGNREDPLQRIGSMGVVHHDAERLPGLDLLESARHGGEVRDPRLHDLAGKPELEAGAGRPQDIREVVPAGEGRGDLQRTPGGAQGGPDAGEVERGRPGK